MCGARAGEFKGIHPILQTVLEQNSEGSKELNQLCPPVSGDFLCLLFCTYLSLWQGLGGPVNWLLSWSGWVPLARLSYSTYLIHMTLVDWVLTLPSYSVTITHTLVLYYILANTAISIAIAFVLVVVFEAPLLHMEKLLFASLGIGKLQPVKKKIA